MVCNPLGIGIAVLNVDPQDKVKVKFNQIQGVGVIVVELGEVARSSFVSSSIWYPNSAFNELLRVCSIVLVVGRNTVPIQGVVVEPQWFISWRVNGVCSTAT